MPVSCPIVLRLKTRAQFQSVLAGVTLARTPHFALHRHDLTAVGMTDVAGEPVVCVGALVPKRWARRAVTRNAIRRQIYETVSAMARRCAPVALVVRLRATFDPRQFISASSTPLKRAVRAELEQLLASLPPRFSDDPSCAPC